MRDLDRRERAALDQWLTRSDDPTPTLDEVEFDMPDPCDECDFVGMHGEGCSHEVDDAPA